MATSSIAIDTSLVPSLGEGTAFDYIVQNTMKNEIVGKYNAGMNLSTGHNHDGVNSRSLSGGHYTMAEIEAQIIMGVFR